MKKGNETFSSTDLQMVIVDKGITVPLSSFCLFFAVVPFGAYSGFHLFKTILLSNISISLTKPTLS
jgi:hypothetical protein